MIRTVTMIGQIMSTLATLPGEQRPANLDATKAVVAAREFGRRSEAARKDREHSA